MKIVCPACEATYQVPEAVLEQRRGVRCARCGNDWIPGDQPRAALDEAAGPPGAPGGAPDAAPVPDAARPAPAPEPLPPEVPAPAFDAAWTPPPVAPEPEPPPPPPPPPAPRLTQTAASAIAGEESLAAVAPRETPVAAWVGSVAVLVMLALAGIAFRGPIMKAWPPSERLYAALGLK